MKIGSWVRPEVRQNEFGPWRHNPNKVHQVVEVLPGGEWLPLCQIRGRQYTLLPGPEEPDALDRCMVCGHAASRRSLS